MDQRYEKSQGYAVSCQAMCTEISLGYQLYSIVKMIHQAIFLNGTLVKCETWPHFTEQRMVVFERAEQSLFRKVFNAHSKTAIESLYLELGIMPFRFHLMKRRILYFCDIMKRGDNELTKMVVLTQKENPIKGDFYIQVKNDMLTLGIQESNIISISKGTVKDILDAKLSNLAFQHLIKLAHTHSKVHTESYTNLQGMSYLNDVRFTPDLVNLFFRFRIRMYSVRNNFRNNYKQSNIMCPLCEAQKDSQSHLFECTAILQRLQNKPSSKYEDIFSLDNDTLLNVSKELKIFVTVREELLEDSIVPED